MNLRTLPIFLAFFAMGFADAVGPLAGTLESDPAFQLSGFMVGLLPAFTFIAFALLSVPGGVLAARIGRRNLLILAFSLNAVGVLIPSLIVPSYVLLLGSLFLLGAGTTFLQVAGNPIMRDVSAEGQYASNLAFAQFVKGIGSVGSTYVVGALATAGAAAVTLAATGTTDGSVLASYAGTMGWRSIFPVFLVLTVLSLVALLALAQHVFNLDDPRELELFCRGDVREVSVPGSGRTIAYDPMPRIGVGVSRLGTSRATFIGAYAFALAALDARA